MWLGGRLAANVDRDEDSFGLALIPMIFLASNFTFVYFPLAGMETFLWAAVLLGMACVALDHPCAAWLPLLGAFAFGEHPKRRRFTLCSPCLLWLRERQDRRRLIVGNVVFVVAIGAIHGRSVHLLRRRDA